MNRLVMLGGAVLLLLLAIVSTQARPQSAPLADYPTQSTNLAAPVDSASPPSSTVTPEESKVSKFFDDFSTAFKQGTAKVKESFESAATSVKDGVMRGYDYVKDKFSGTGDAVTTPGSPQETSPTTGSDSQTRSIETKVESAKSLGSNSEAPTASSAAATATTTTTTTTRSTTKAVRIEPNDEEPADDDRLIFIGDEDTATDLTPNTTPKTAAATSEKTNLDDRFILDGPLACPKGQTAVNGKCRNTF